MPDTGSPYAAPLARALTAGALLWAVTIVASPLAVRHGGRPAVAAAFVYEAARRICHQRPERSFHLASVQLPVCGRCTGLYFAAAAGAALAWTARRPTAVSARSSRLLLAVAALPMAASVAAELAGIAASSNVARLASALPVGLAGGWLFVRALRAEARPAARRDAL